MRKGTEPEGLLSGGGPVEAVASAAAEPSAHEHDWHLVEVHYDMEPCAEEYACTHCGEPELRLPDQ